MLCGEVVVSLVVQFVLGYAIHTAIFPLRRPLFNLSWGMRFRTCEKFRGSADH